MVGLCAVYAVILFLAPFTIWLRIPMVAGYSSPSSTGYSRSFFGLGMLLLLVELARFHPPRGKAGPRWRCSRGLSLPAACSHSPSRHVALGLGRCRRPPMLFVGGIVASVVVRPHVHPHVRLPLFSLVSRTPRSNRSPSRRVSRRRSRPVAGLPDSRRRRPLEPNVLDNLPSTVRCTALGFAWWSSSPALRTDVCVPALG